MKRIISAFIILVIILLPNAIHAIDVPSSARSKKAISRLEPGLKAELVRSDLRYGAPIFIRIFKETKELEVWIKGKQGFKLFKTYPVCAYGKGGLGPKLCHGDGMAPEGFYYVTPMQINPQSRFHLSFNLGYPNAYDRSCGRTGSALMVHGDCVSIGCYAMTNQGIEEIFALAVSALKKGQPYFRVHIFPFRMTDKNIHKYKDAPWVSFWRNLKQGYDFFENNGHYPPDVTVKDRRYLFGNTK